ncbi:MAG TPA: hypothetical protein VMR50_14365 [Myxococcota bacterium]|nr:hypothetical protein [Myxococcota bacterium]
MSDSLPLAELVRRNARIDALGAAWALPALLVPFVLYAQGVPRDNAWPLGLGIGLAVILPATHVALFTLPQGTQRLREFLRYYELRWGVGHGSLALLCLPLALLGLVSALELAL